MVSAINPALPADAPALANKGDLRTNLGHAKTEIEAVQSAVTALQSAVTLAANEIYGRLATGGALGLGASEVPTQAAPASGHFLVGWASGVLNKFDVGALPPPLIPFTPSVSGSQAAQPTGRKWRLSGDVSAIPITNGWEGLYANFSGAARKVTTATGNCRLTETKVAVAGTIGFMIPNNSCIVVIGDGVDLIVLGDAEPVP